MQADDREPPVRSVWAFFALTFAIAWGGMGLTLVYQEEVEAMLGPMGASNPLFILAVWAPAISAIFLVLRHGGLPGLGVQSRHLVDRVEDESIWL